MATEKGYQGWKNYETWSVALIFDNDEPLYNMTREWAQEAIKNEKNRDDAIGALARQVKDFVEEGMPEVRGLEGLYEQLLGAAIEEIDWHEIAESWIDREEE